MTATMALIADADLLIVVPILRSTEACLRLQYTYREWAQQQKDTRECPVLVDTQALGPS